MILTGKKLLQYFDVKRFANGHRVSFHLNRGSLIEWRQLELYQVTYFPHHNILFILSSNYLGWFISAHFPIWKIISLNLSSLLFQNEMSEILIPCSIFILYVDYVWSPILHDRDVRTLSEVRLSLLQAKTGTTKRFYTCWIFFLLSSSLLHIWKPNIYSVAENRQVV